VSHCPIIQASVSWPGRDSIDGDLERQGNEGIPRRDDFNSFDESKSCQTTHFSARTCARVSLQSYEAPVNGESRSGRARITNTRKSLTKRSHLTKGISCHLIQREDDGDKASRRDERSVVQGEYRKRIRTEAGKDEKYSKIWLITS